MPYIDLFKPRLPFFTAVLVLVIFIGTVGIFYWQFLSLTAESAINNGANAVNVIGQTDGVGAIRYTTGNKNNNLDGIGLDSPQFTAIDTTNNRLFVSDTGNNRVLVFNLSSSDVLLDYTADAVLGQADMNNNSSSTASQSSLRSPQGLAYDSSGNRLFVADKANNRIMVFDVAAITNGENAINVLGQADFTSSSAATTQSGLSSPVGLDYDSGSSDLFVVDQGNNRVLVFDVASITNGENATLVFGQADFASNGSATNNSVLNTPAGVDYENTNSRLFVSDGMNNRVVVINMATVFTITRQPYAYTGTNYEKLLDNSGNGVSLLYDNTGVVGADLMNIDENSKDISSIINSGSPQTWNLVLVHKDNNMVNTTLYVDNAKFVSSAAVETYLDSIFDADDWDIIAFVPSVFVYESSDYTFNDPLSCALPPCTTPLSLAPAWEGTVDLAVIPVANGERFDSVLGQADFTSSGSGLTQSTFNLPGGVAYDANNNKLFVSDTNNSRVMIFDVTAITDGENASNVLGQSDFTTCTAATTQAGLRSPGGAMYNTANNRVFITDTYNSRLMIFDVASILNGENAVNGAGQINGGVPVYTKGGENNGPIATGLNVPVYTALDTVGHRLFVSDNGNSRVLVFNLDATDTLVDYTAHAVLGQSDFVTNAPSTTQAGLWGPAGLAYDSDRKLLFVSDNNNNRVMVFDVGTIVDGENAVSVLGQTDYVTRASDRTQSKMRLPSGLAYDQANTRLFVADYNSNRVLVFNVATIVNGEDAINVLGQGDYVSGACATTSSGFCFTSDAGDVVGIGLAYDSSNKRLFVADAGNERVLVHDVTPATIANGQSAANVLGQTNFTSSSSGMTQSTLNNPVGVDYDSSYARLFVSDFGNQRVLSFSVSSITDGENAVNVLGAADFTSAPSATPAQNNQLSPTGVLYNATNGRLYVASMSFHRVMVFDALNNSAPIAIIPSPGYVQSTDGSGYVALTVQVDDADDDNLKLKVKYSEDGGSNWYLAKLASVTASVGTPDLSSSSYQIGTNTPISTASGSNLLTIVWDTKSAFNQNGSLDATDQSDIQVRFTPNDITGAGDGIAQSIASFEVDNLKPSGMTALMSSAQTSASATLNWTAVTETNFNHYEIWYGTNQTTVEARTASEWDNSDDTDLATKTKTTTTITGLTAGTTYYFAIWAVDNFGNEENITTLSQATSADTRRSVSGDTPAPIPEPTPEETVVPIAEVKTQCSDGLDNDGDGKIDLADPGCSSVTDNSEVDEVAGVPVLTQLEDGLITNDNQQEIIGTTAFSSQPFDIYIDNIIVHSSISQSDKSYSWKIYPALIDGAHEIYVTADGIASPKINFTIDTVAPVASSIDSITSVKKSQAGGKANLEVTVTGKAPVDAKYVSIYLNDSVLISTVEPSAGIWSYKFTKELTPGEYAVTAKAVDSAGNIAPVSEAKNFVAAVTAEEPAKPVVLEIKPIEPVKPIALVKPIASEQPKTSILPVVPVTPVQLGVPSERAEQPGGETVLPGLSISEGGQAAGETASSSARQATEQEAAGMQQVATFIDSVNEAGIVDVNQVLDALSSGTISLAGKKQIIDNPIVRAKMAEIDMKKEWDKTKEERKLEIEYGTVKIVESGAMQRAIVGTAKVVSAVTNIDLFEVEKNVQKTVEFAVKATLVTQKATIDNPMAEKINDVTREETMTVAGATSIAAVATVGATGVTGATALTYLQFLFTSPILLTARRKKFGFGVVYNSVTKQPVDLATIRVYRSDTKKLVATKVTDRYGRYQFILNPGNYYLIASHQDLKFPCTLLENKRTDGDFQNVYYGSEFELTEKKVVNQPIAMDPDRALRKNKHEVRLQLTRKAVFVMTLCGPVLAIISFAINPQLWVGGAVVAQIVMYEIFRRLGFGEKPKSWGSVRDSENKSSLARAIIRVFDTKFNKLLETQVTDGKGRYAFLVGNQEYYLAAAKPGYFEKRTARINLTNEKSGYLVEDLVLRPNHLGAEVARAQEQGEQYTLRTGLGRQEEKQVNGTQKVVRREEEKFQGDLPEVNLDDMHEDFYDVDYLDK